MMTIHPDHPTDINHALGIKTMQIHPYYNLMDGVLIMVICYFIVDESR